MSDWNLWGYYMGRPIWWRDRAASTEYTWVVEGAPPAQGGQVFRSSTLTKRAIDNHYDAVTYRGSDPCDD